MRAVCITLLLCAFFTSLRAQSPSPFDPVNLAAPDLKNFNKLTFQAINDLRYEKKIFALVWDDVLFRAAQDQATYLLKQTKLTHNQSSKDKSTPFQRVKLHGGLSYKRAGENLVRVTLGVNSSKTGRRFSTVTYNATAQAMALLWKLSPGHYKNIMDPRFNTSAIATAYDERSQRLVCVQVFGFTNITSVGEQADHSEQLLSLPARKLPYRLKAAKPHIKSNRSIRAFMSLRVDRGYLVGSFRTAKKAFRGIRSGITQEFIHLSQFDSGALDYNLVRNRRNGLFALSGDLTKPIYRSKMLKYSRQNTNRKWWINLRIIRIKERTKLFVYPLDGATESSEFNIFLIRKRRLETYRSYDKIPGRSFTCPMPQLNMVNNFKRISMLPRTKTISKYDTLEVKAFFAEAKTELDPIVKRKLNSILDSLHAKVVKLEASAFASVDGNQQQNEDLARQRLGSVMIALRSHLDTISIDPVVSTNEQWKLFYEQIKRHHLVSLQNLKKSALRDYVNNNKKDSLISKLLSEQRYMVFKIIIRRDSIVSLPRPDLVEKYYQAKRNFESKQRKSARDVTALENAQLAAYRQLIEAKSDSIPGIVVSDQYPVFGYHDLLFRYMVTRSISDEVLYKRLHQLGKSKYFPARLRNQLVFNNLTLIFSNFWPEVGLSGFMDPEELYCKPYFNSEFLIRTYKRLKCWKYQAKYDSTYYILNALPSLIAYGQKIKLSDFPVDSLWRFYYLSKINTLSNQIPLPLEIYSLLPKFKEYFHPNDQLLSIEQRVTLAFFYCQFFKYETARMLLKPVADHLSNIPPGYKLYLSLQRDSFKEEHEFSAYIISHFDKLGKTEWCSLWQQSEYLNFLLLEDLNLRNFYNCKCKE